VQEVDRVAGLYLVIQKNQTLLFADTTVNVHPDASDLAEIAVLAGRDGRFFRHGAPGGHALLFQFRQRAQ
jgi:phosphotransacetylase